MTEILWRSLTIGIGATALMDVWAIFLNRTFGNPLPNWALAGRWFCHMTEGKLFHDDIATAVPWPNELAVGWTAHYAIGIVYAGSCSSRQDRNGPQPRASCRPGSSD